MYSVLTCCAFTRCLPKFYLCKYRMMTAYTRLPSNKVQLDVLQGCIIGSESKLPNEKPFYSFRGIPYAEPPIGKLRFAPPKPLSKFKVSALDCTIERDVCFHRDMLTSETIGSEDCLFLNVYAPSDAKDLPVMIWLHGGAFASGSGNSDYYSPEYLVEQNVIIVTLNYRLGILGFLCLPDAGIFGNAGLKDQRLAMQWVQQNIAKFGGNPNNVTIFGGSAGAACVHIHTLSGQSRKYFHKAICQSGNALMEWVFQQNAEEKSKILAKNLGCTETDSNKILEFLRGIEQLPIYTDKEYFTTMTADERRRGLPIVFKPNVERDTEEAIIVKSPLELMKSPIDSKIIPIMMGYNSKEGIVMIIKNVKNKELDQIDNDLARLIPKSVNLASDDERCMYLAKRMKQFYFNGNKISNDTVEELVDLNTDYHFSIFSYLAAELHARYQNSPMYFYRFSVDKDFNLYKKFALMMMGLSDTKKFKGANHTDDVYYLFRCQKFPVDTKDFPESEALLRRTCELWTNFAKYGDPTSDSNFSVHWKPVDKLLSNDEQFNLNYMEMDNDKLINAVNPDGERFNFWKKVYDDFNDGLHGAKL